MWSLIEAYKEKESYIAELSDEHGYQPTITTSVSGLSVALINFIANHWLHHVRQAQEKEEIDLELAGLLKAFLGSPKESTVQYQRWLEDFKRLTQWPPSKLFIMAIDLWYVRPADSCVVIICGFGFYELLKDWWNDEENLLSQLSHMNVDLLQLAMSANRKPICEILLRRGIETSGPGEKGRALLTAAGTGRIDLVRFFIDKGTDINQIPQYTPYGTALIAAVAAAATTKNDGNIEIIKLLVEQGADVNLANNYDMAFYGSALAAAAASGNVNIVELLIAKGADVNLTLRTGRGSALAEAVARGNINTVRLLVEQGADVNTQLLTGNKRAEAARALQAFQPEWGFYRYGSALITAIVRNRHDIAEYLIEYHADVNLVVEYGIYCSALQAAVINGTQVELLVENGVNMNQLFETGPYGSALAAAAFQGRKKTVKILLDAGATASLALSHGDHATALDAALAGEEAFRKYPHRDADTELRAQNYIGIRDMLQHAIQREERAT